MSSQEEIIQKIRYYQEKLDRYAANKSHDKIICILNKLKQLPIRTVHLEQTGIGRTVNALKKMGDDVSEISKSIVMSWKDMVREEEEQNSAENEENNADAPEAYQSDEPNIEEDEEPPLSHDDIEQNDDCEQDAETSHESRGTNRTTHLQEHNGFDSESHSEEEYQQKVSKSHHKDRTDRDKHGERKQKRKHESSKSRDESHESSSKKHKHSSSRSDRKEKYGEGHSNKSGDRESNKHSEKDGKKSHGKNKQDHKESGKSTDTKAKHDNKKTDHNKSAKKSDDQKSESNHKSDRHHSSDKHHHSDKNEAKQHSKKNNTNSQEKSSEKEVKSKHPKDLKRKHEREPDDMPSSSKKLKKEETKEPEKPSDHKKSDKTEKKSSKSKSSKPYGNGFSIDSESGASFAEALGMCSGPSSSGTSKAVSVPKKKNVAPAERNTAAQKSVITPSERAKVETLEYVPSALKQPQLEPLAINISSLLPEITPNYKPLGAAIDMHQSTRRISITDEEALSRAMMNKNQRTKVYSGNKSFGKVESLFDLCVRILQDNIDALEYTGGVPFSILKPVLQRASPDQLFNLEHHNPYLIEDTDDLWKKHCEKDFRTKKREEMESWREMYMRCLQEREARLSAITATIKQSQDKSIPVRTTKLAYVDSVVKPPRNIARKQAKNGTANAVTPSERLQQISKSNEAVKVPSSGSRAVDRPSTSSMQSNKPKKAPLMAKALQSFKNRFRR